MAAQLTALTEFSDNGNSRTYTTAGHTASDPKLVIQSRRVPSGNQVVAESTVRVIHQTDDADGNPLDAKISFEAVCRYPISGVTADVDAALVIFRDIIAGDEYGNTVGTQEWLS